MTFLQRLRLLFTKKRRSVAYHTKKSFRARPMVECLEERTLLSTVAHDSLGDTFITGSFSGQRDFGGGVVYSSAGTADIFVAEYSPAGALLWAKDMPGSRNTTSQGNGIALDSSGNVYITGSFQGTVDFNPDAGTNLLKSVGGNDIFVAKLTGNGTFVWAQSAGGSSDDAGNDIAVDSSGKVWVTGSFQNSVDFDPGVKTATLTSVGGYDAFLWDLTSSGQYVGVQQFGGSGDQRGNGLAVDASGNVYLTGWTTAQAEFDPGPGATKVTSDGGDDVYVLKLSNSGTLIWADDFGGKSDDKGFQIAVDSSGNVYETGTFEGTANFNPAGSYPMTSLGSTNDYIVKLNASGSFQWARQFGSSEGDVQGLAIAPSGNLIVEGDFRGNGNFGPTIHLTSAGSQDVFVTALNPQGTFQWARDAGGSAADSAAGLTVDASGNVYAVGEFSGSANFNPAGGGFLLKTASDADFLWKLNNAGGFLSAESFNQTPGITTSVSTVAGFKLINLPIATTAGTVVALTVEAVDADGNLVSGYDGTIQLTSTGADDVLPANYTFTAADAGVHTFTITLKTAGITSITAADIANSSIAVTQSGINVSPAAASSFAVSAPAATTAGNAFIVTVTAMDRFGNVATGYTGTVHFSSADRAALLPANFTFTPGDAGIETFSVTLKTAGTKSISVASSTIAGSASNIAVSAAAASSFVVKAPTVATAGSPFNVTLTAKDIYGNIATGYTGTVHFTSSDGAAVLPADYTFTAANAGVSSTFSVTLETVGATSITATDTANGALSVTQPNIRVNAAPATSFVVTAPANAMAGSAFDVTLTAMNNLGNIATGYTGTVHFTSSDGAAQLPANYTFTAADGGVHTFSVTLKTAGAMSIMAASSTIATAQSAVDVSAVPASSFVLKVPANATAGTPFNVTLTALGGNGSIATGYTGTVHFTSSDGAAVLPADYTFLASNEGVHTFSIMLRTAGAMSLTATDTTNNALTVSQSVKVGAAAASSFVVNAPAAVTTGSAFSVTLTALDSLGNIATGYTGTVHFSSSDGAAQLPANYTFTAGDAGVHTFNVALKTAGNMSITAASSTISASQSNISVSANLSTPGVASSFVINAPVATTAGNAFNVTVTALDSNGNVATGYTGTVQFSSSDGAATLPASYTFTAGDAGVHTFSISLNTAGAASITATDTANSALTVSQSGINVSAAAASSFIVSAPAAVTAGTAFNVTLTAIDLFGNIATGYTGAAHFSSSDGAALLPANYTFTAGDAGVHTFSITLNTVGDMSITATDAASSLLTGSQSGIDVSSAATTAPATSSFVITAPTTTTAGSAFNVTLTAKDSNGNIATGYTGTVHFTSSDGAALLPADYTFTAGDAGVHTFSITLKTAGAMSITATDTANSALTISQSGINVSAAAASFFVVKAPTAAATGSAFNVTLTALDSFGNIATGYTGTVHLTSSDGAATLPANYTFTAGDAGVHTFSITLKTVGAMAIAATDTANSALTISQSGINVSAAAATSFIVSAPTAATAGSAFNVTLTAKDGNGNIATGYTGTVHFTSSDGAAGLPANYTFTAGDAGVHTFSITLKTAGAMAITATDSANSALTVSQSGINVSAGAASSFVVKAPTTATAGSAFNVTVTAKDSFGNVATGYTGTVHFTSSDGAATLPANYTFTTGDAGVHTFSITLKTAGAMAITATDTANSALTVSQSGINVGAGAASSLIIKAPTSAATGSAFNVTLTAKDSFGNIATGYTGTVHFTSSDGAATLPANYTFTAGDAGVHTFSITLKTAGAMAITATDTANSALTISQSGINVSAAAASSFVVNAPTTATAGSAFNVTLTARDSNGNIATGYTGTVHFTSSDGAATLPANYTFTAGDAGVHTFSITLKTAGAMAITATDTANSALTVSQSGINVSPGAASSFVVKAPATTTAGSAVNVTLTVKDSNGNIATGYTGTVHFTSSDGAATLPANYTFTAGDAGVHTFSITLKTAGAMAITATDAANSAITVSQSGINVSAAAASSFIVTAPATATSGSAFNVTLTAKDSFGNIATGYTGTVHFTSTDGAATLPANYTFKASDAGVHTFSITLKTAGAMAITATDTANSALTVSQSGINVSAGAANAFIFSAPAIATAGSAYNVTLTVRDSNGNIATGYTGTVHFTSSDGAATLPANYTFKAGDAGVHTFSVTLKTAGTTSITVADTASSSLTVTQSGIKVSAAAASSFVVNAPTSAATGSAFSVTLTAKDSFGNIATGYTGTVHFTSSDGAASLPANYTFTAGDAGVHTFSVTLNTAGAMSITATDTANSSLTVSQSGINVSTGAASSFVIKVPTTATAGTAFNVTLTAMGSNGSVATGYTGTVHFTSSDGAATLPANFTFTAANDGVHTFSITLKTAGAMSITATDAANSAITVSQSGINVSAAAASSLVITAPTTTTAGSAFNITLTALDSFGNIATGYTGAVHFTSSDSAATLPANYTFKASDAGVHTFSYTLKTAGSKSITAASSSLTVTQSGINVSAAAASSFVVTSPTTATAGAAFNVLLTAKDSFGNIVTGYTGTVHFTSSDSAATLPANYTFTAGDAGVHTFGVTLKTAGTQTVTMTDTANSALKATSANITVSSTVNSNPPPSTNFNLSNWYLTLPTGKAGDPTTITTSQLTAGYTSAYFYTGANGAMVFWSPVTGVTTKGSANPRSELRETLPNGSLYNWSVTAGTATLSATVAVNQVPGTGDVVIGQIHDDGANGITDEPLIKLEYEYNFKTDTGSLVAQVRPTPSSSTNNNFTLLTNVPLNALFTYQIQLQKNLTLSVQINGVTEYSAPISSSWESQGMYFKAGAYTQDNVGTSADGALVSFYALNVTHTT